MWKLTSIFVLALSLHSYGQQITVVDNKNFKIDSTEYSIGKIKYLRKTEVPFVRGGESKYARNSQIFFTLKNTSSLSLSIGDSSYIGSLLWSRKNLPEYYLYSDTVTEQGGKLIYTYSYPANVTSEEHQSVLSSIILNDKKYFVLVDTDAESLEYAINLINDLETLE